MGIIRWVLDEDRKSAAIETDKEFLAVYGIEENIIRCVCIGKKEGQAEFPDTPFREGKAESPMDLFRSCKAELTIEELVNALLIETKKTSLYIDRATGRFSWSEKETGRVLLEEGYRELTEIPVYEYSTGGEEPVIRRVRTVDGDRNFVENLKPHEDHRAYRAKLQFQFQPGERIHGLGQGEAGIFDYRGHTQYLYQHNMRIPAPVILSDQGYGILADCGSLMVFKDEDLESYLLLDTVKALDYYFVAGKDAEEIIKGFRRLTGKAAMLPKWAFGYVQSRERYRTQEEIVSIASEYRKRGIGLDCVVQDWKTWEGDGWGQKTTDHGRYPDIPGMSSKLHDMHVHSMVSVWPNMNYDTPDCQEMQEKGYLLLDLATYNAFLPEARELYWNQANKELFADGKGFDSWWCDSTEPFSGPDWGGETRRPEEERFRLVGDEHKKFLGAERANLYAAYHARGIYENQRKTAPDKRVLNLTRSGYPGIQRYGTMLWSGDITATWETLRKQIVEGMNASMSGYPYWTLDIGGFFVLKENWKHRGCGCENDPSPKWFWQGDYEEGVKDPAYRELYVRWLEEGVFLPMFRSHGTDTPREIWNFGEPGDPFYEAIKENIRLRYRLIPYIYSLAGQVCLDDTTMLRSLFFDFPDDPRAGETEDEFLFGRNFLVCPVTSPMYYDRGGKALDRPKVRKCYLPKGADWYDFYTRERYEGGQEIYAEAGLSHIPVFVRAGSLIPMESGLSYAQEQSDQPFEIHIYPGEDQSFVYYEDEGDGYGYEKGIYNRILMTWKDKEKVFRISEAKKDIKGGLKGRTCRIIIEGSDQDECADSCNLEFVYKGEEEEIPCSTRTTGKKQR